MEIPWSRDPRPDTGLTNATLGMWLFLASELMLFGALFSGYVLLRTGNPAWPQGAARLDLPLGTVNTLILIASGVILTIGGRAARVGQIARARLAVLVSGLLGMLFLALKGYEWAEHLQAGERPATDNFFATYYTLTGVHALHVIGGLGVLAYLWIAAARAPGTPAGFAQRLALMVLYWQFVDVVWLVLFTTLYLL